MEKWQITGLGQGKYKTSLEYFVPEHKEVLKKYWRYVKRTNFFIVCPPTILQEKVFSVWL